MDNISRRNLFKATGAVAIGSFIKPIVVIEYNPIAEIMVLANALRDAVNQHMLTQYEIYNNV